MVKEDGSYCVMEVWYGDSGKPESFLPVSLSDPIHEDLLNVKCDGCANDEEKDAAARFQIIKELTAIINDLSNDAASLIYRGKGKERNEMFDTELFVTYDGSNVMRWIAHGGRSGSDPVGLLSDKDAVKWAEAKLVSLDCDHLNFSIDEED